MVNRNELIVVVETVCKDIMKIVKQYNNLDGVKNVFYEETSILEYLTHFQSLAVIHDITERYKLNMEKNEVKLLIKAFNLIYHPISGKSTPQSLIQRDSCKITAR